MLTPEELNRYDRHIGIDSWGEASQLKLKKSKVFVAGAGGLGSAVLYYLASAGIGNLTVCDFDRVDISNLNRQILHSNMRIGNIKSESACETISTYNPDINITSLNEKITDDNVSSIIDGFDLIMDCMDNFITRHVINRVSVNKNIPMIHAGISGFTGQLTFLHPRGTPCLNCIIPETGAGKKIYVAGATAGAVGSMQAAEAIKYLTGMNNNLKNRLLFIDLLNMNFSSINISKNPRCRICGKS